MDRGVKERLVGASILVALIVLVVPELLSGPKPAAQPPTLPASEPAPNRIVTVDLATSKAPATPSLEPAASQPEAASAASAAKTEDTAAAPPAAVSSSVAPEISSSSSLAPASLAPASPAPVESAAPSPISSRAAWAVQLGSFASRANAENLSRQLKGQGFSVYVLPGGSGASVRYRVRVGPLADRGSAERMAVKLRSIGHVSSLVGPAG
jgi:DedD protein